MVGGGPCLGQPIDAFEGEILMPKNGSFVYPNFTLGLPWGRFGVRDKNGSFVYPTLPSIPLGMRGGGYHCCSREGKGARDCIV